MTTGTSRSSFSRQLKFYLFENVQHVYA